MLSAYFRNEKPSKPVVLACSAPFPLATTTTLIELAANYYIHWLFLPPPLPFTGVLNWTFPPKRTGSVHAGDINTLPITKSSRILILLISLLRTSRFPYQKWIMVIKNWNPMWRWINSLYPWWDASYGQLTLVKEKLISGTTLLQEDEMMENK